MSLEISCDDVHAKRQRGEKFLLLDCREQNEWDQVHIEGGELLPMSELADRASELNDRKSDEIVVYCHHGGRSLRVTRWLQQQGFSNVKSMSGGIDDWAARIEPGMVRY